MFKISENSIRNADVSIATYWVSSIWLNKLSSKKGKKVYFIQGLETEYSKGIRAKVAATYKFKVDHFITVSTELQTQLSAFGCDAELVINGIPSSEIPYKYKPPMLGERIVIGFPYREDDEIKNCRQGIEVLKKLFYDGVVDVHGFGFSKPNEWPEKWQFICNPSREDLILFYEKIDLFYVPSVHEGWGLPAMEAMAHGRVVIMGCFGIIAVLLSRIQKTLVKHIKG